MNCAEVAVPEAFVTAVFWPPANEPLAPLPGAANVTVAPLTGLLPESRTSTVNGFPKGELSGALCGDPPVIVRDAGEPD